MVRRVLAAAALVGFVCPVSAQKLDFVHQMLPSDRDATAAVAFGDVDADGDLDVVAGNEMRPGIAGGGGANSQNRLFLNDGTGRFTDVTISHLPAVLDDTTSAALGDVDGDGDLDLFFGNEGQSRLLLNDGTGVFTDVTATNLPVLADATQDVALADVDGDGDLDAYLANGVPGYFGAPPSQPEQDRLLLNDGTGAFLDATLTHLPMLLDVGVAVAVGDLDGDGDLDALVGSFWGTPRLYENDGFGHFTDVSASDLPLPPPGTDLDVALADLDGDGDLDAVIGDNLYFNDASGVFSLAPAPLALPPTQGWVEAIALGDVDGDGDLDAFVGLNSMHKYGAQNGLCLNDGFGSFTEVTSTNLPAIQDKTQAVALGDVDGDADLDAWVANGISLLERQDRLHLNDGSGVFVDVTAVDVPVPVPTVATNEAALGDLDGDGDLDVYMANGETYVQQAQDTLYLNDGTARLLDATATHVPALPDWTLHAVLGDVDRDGDLDVLTSNFFSPDALYLNDGFGVLTDVSATNLPATFLGGPPAFGDVDGDGDLDAFSGDRLAVNDGSGVFLDVTASNFPAVCPIPQNLALGDVDGDGDLDVFFGPCLYLNDGTGVFADATATNLPAFGGTVTEVALGDVDGDGDLDAFLGTSAAPPELLWLNGGGGLFVDATATHLPPPGPGGTHGVDLGDLDDDGDLDAFLLRSGLALVYRNNGAGVFADVTAGNVPDLSGLAKFLALGDLDGDGDLDAFLGGSGVDGGPQNRVLTNLARQLSWRGVPRVGKPLTLDFHGPALGAWFLALSLAEASVPIPPLGTFRLDPSTLIYLDEGLLDGNGRYSVTYMVPADPILLGAIVYWQGVVSSPSRFTNLEVTALTGL